jgi:hypothetical protein
MLDAAAEGLNNLPKTSLPKLPRMADFALWASACETAFWRPGAFWSAYAENLEEAVAALTDDDRVASAVRKLLASEREWTGTATDLLKDLSGEVGDQIAKSKDWPQNPRAMSGCVRRLAPALRKVGIDVAFPHEKDKKRTRTILLRALSHQDQGPPQPYALFAAPESEEKFASIPSASSASAPDGNEKNGLAATAERTVERPVAHAADGRNDGVSYTVLNSVHNNPLNSNDRTVADGADAKFPSESGANESDARAWRGRL